MTAAKRKVLHVSSACSIGGCEAHVLALLSRLQAGSYDRWLAYFEERPDEARSMVTDFQVQGVRTVDLRGHGRLDPATIVRLFRLLRAERFDLVHAHSLRAELAAVVAARFVKPRPRIVRTIHNTDDYYRRAPASWLTRRSSTFLDTVIVISDAVGEYILNNTGLPREKVRRIYYGLDPEPYENVPPVEVPPRYSTLQPRRHPTIGMIARLAPQKGHNVLLEALPEVVARLPDLRVELVGHEHLTTSDELRRRASHLGLDGNVIFAGFRDDIPRLLARWDLLVLPSLWEGFGLVLLEAMAAGRPIVASNVGPIPEIVIDGQTGLLVEPGQPEPLAAALLQVLQEPNLAARLGAAGRRRLAQHFTVERMVEETHRVYDQVIGSPKAAAFVYPSTRLRYVPCPGCGTGDGVQITQEFGLGIRRCERCSLMYVSPRLHEPQQHYHGEREGILTKYGAILKGQKPHNRDPNYRQELAVLARLKPVGRLLDIGTHCGFFLRMARGMGWELHGVEPSPAAQLAREFFGLNVHQGLLEHLEFPAESFDVVTLIDVVEHLDNPPQLLAEVRRVLKPDGLVFIKTPNARYNLFKERLIRRTLGLERVEIFDAKEHVVQYTRETLGWVLNRAGLDVIYDFVPRPIQDGSAWKCVLRSAAHSLARAHHGLSGGQFGPLATDLAVVASKRVGQERAA